MTELRISWSSLRTHAECRQKSHLQRTGHKAKMENVRVFFPGTVTDRVVRDWLSMENPGANLGLMPEMVEAIVDREERSIIDSGKKLKWKDSKDRDSIIDECKRAVTDIEPYLVKYVLPYEYDVDFRFEAPIRTMNPHTGEPSVIILNGFMDIIVKDPATGKWYVYDVKHTKDEYYYKKTRGQLSFYDLAVEIMFEQTTAETGLLQPLCKEKLKSFVITEDERRVLLKSVLDMAKDVWFNETEPNPKHPSECTYCNVKHACSKFVPVQGPDGKKRVPLLLRKDTP